MSHRPRLGILGVFVIATSAVLLLADISTQQIKAAAQSYADDMRLVGPSPGRGRLEVRYSGEWKSVCDSNNGPRFGPHEGEVACRTLGFQSNTPLIERMTGYRRIWLEHVVCRGNESSMSECVIDGPFRINLGCQFPISLQCLNIDQNAISNASVRLTGGSSTSGRLEVSVIDIWGTVCDDGFDAHAAQVVCRMLNLPSAFASPYRFAVVNEYQSELPILLDDVNCTGTETALLQCGHMGFFQHNCINSENVGVFCTDDEHAMHHHEIRLVGSNNTNMGRVEVQYFGIWGTVCTSGWRSVGNIVICRSLNLPYQNAHQIPSGFGLATGPKWLDFVRCTGDEPSLFGCQHTQIGRTTCVGGQSLAVMCQWPREGNFYYIYHWNDWPGYRPSHSCSESSKIVLSWPAN